MGCMSGTRRALVSSSTSEGILFKGLSGRYKPDTMMDGYEVVPDNEIVGWGEPGRAPTLKAVFATQRHSTNRS
jgi:hypothetical protein